MKAVIVRSRCSEHPLVHFLAKLLFASCRAPLIKDIKQNWNYIIDVFLKWRRLAPNSFTLILPQHWKLTLCWFLFSETHWLNCLSDRLHFNTKRLFTPKKASVGLTTALASTDGHWCVWEKENWRFWRSPGWISASTTPALRAGPQEVQIHNYHHTPSHRLHVLSYSCLHVKEPSVDICRCFLSCSLINRCEQSLTVYSPLALFCLICSFIDDLWQTAFDIIYNYLFLYAIIQWRGRTRQRNDHSAPHDVWASSVVMLAWISLEERQCESQTAQSE